MALVAYAMSKEQKKDLVNKEGYNEMELQMK